MYSSRLAVALTEAVGLSLPSSGGDIPRGSRRLEKYEDSFPIDVIAGLVCQPGRLEGCSTAPDGRCVSFECFPSCRAHTGLCTTNPAEGSDEWAISPHLSKFRRDLRTQPLAHQPLVANWQTTSSPQLLLLPHSLYPARPWSLCAINKR